MICFSSGDFENARLGRKASPVPHSEGCAPSCPHALCALQGEVNLVYRKIFPWCPKEPWTAGHETAVAVGPKVSWVGV